MIRLGLLSILLACAMLDFGCKSEIATGMHKAEVDKILGSPKECWRVMPYAIGYSCRYKVADTERVVNFRNDTVFNWH